MQKNSFTWNGVTDPSDPNYLTDKLFGGWQLDAAIEFGNAENDKTPDYFDEDTVRVTSDMSLYARWGTPRTITFDENNGTGTMDSVIVVKEFSMPLPANAFVAPAGKEFAGWSAWNTTDNKAGVSVLCRDKEGIPSGNDSVTKLNAIWMGMETVDKGTTWKIGTSLQYPDGNSKERNPIKVQFDNSFMLSDHEVTVKEWTEIMNVSLENMTDTEYLSEYEPMRYVSWLEAVIYCNRKTLADESLTDSDLCYTIDGVDWRNIKLSTNPLNINGVSVTCDFSKAGYRLPTEAEWECAVRGASRAEVVDKVILVNDTVAKVADIDVDTMIKPYGNTGGIEHSAPVSDKYKPVMSFQHVAGLYDIVGNVSEWCWDDYDMYKQGEAYYDGLDRTSNQGAVADVADMSKKSVHRGSAYSSSTTGDWRRITFKDEMNSDKNRRFQEIGFRVCRTVAP